MSFNRMLTIGDVAKVFDGPHATPKKIDTGPYFLSISSLENGKLDLSKSAHLSDEDFAKWTRRVTPEAGDILFSYETRLGEVAMMPAGVTACLGRRMGLLRPDRTKILPEYLLYAYQSNAFQEVIRANTIHGATVDRIALKDLPSFPIQVPPLKEQQKIIDILKGYDRKLVLNLETNQTLEAMAQAIFKSWFVDFDPVKAKMNGEQPEGMDAATASLFPEKLVESELGLIPEGWTVKPFKKVIDKYVDNRGKTPPVVEDGIPLVEVKHLPENSAFPNLNTDKHVTEETFNTWFRVHVEPKDVLISTVGTIGRTSFVKNTNFGIAQNVLGLRFGKVVEPEYMFYTIKAHRFQNDMDARLVTTVQSSIKRKDLDTIDILVPPSNVQKEFCKLVGSLLDGQYSKNAENIELARLRDTLLPKLLSGEIELGSSEELVEAI
ncbi:TPA: restriction endonuclease subunit S [Vibrio cholerae]